MSNPLVHFGLWLMRQPEPVHLFPQELQLNLILVLAPRMRVVKQEMHSFEHHLDLKLALDAIHRLAVHVAGLLAGFLLEVRFVL